MQQCYNLLFRTFIAFCICAELKCEQIDVIQVLSFLEYLARNKVLVCMLSNYVSALKVKFTFGLNYQVWDHPNVKYVIRAIKIKLSLICTLQVSWSNAVIKSTKGLSLKLCFSWGFSDFFVF